MSNIMVNLSHKTYPIYITKGLMNSIGKEIKKIYSGNKIAVVTDSNVNSFYGDRLEKALKDENYNVKTLVVEAGEKSKSFEVLLKLYDELLDFEITRGDLIIALGGGVVGDLTGFAAATTLRGISFIQVPTSLLAQIDSSIGGKVAVDLPRGKNLIGNFYHPEAVFIDPDVLKTLDKKFLHDGMGEVIKYGAIKDRQLFDKLMTFKDDNDLLDHIDEIIYRCCSIKKEVVEKDEKDKGDRMLLNFGHTLGHVIEKYFNYEKYTHGEAVSIGMYKITEKSEAMGITEKGTSELLKKILIKYGLPFEVEALNKDKVLETISMDKKNDRDRINIILLNKLGEAFIKNIDSKLMENYI
ncbi:3-dehydroquinate synthase [Clostridium pasteurianum DSM 525 = ATCC 6013]|uniref:3-dehydroquinate synthase n=1 Tax=Clostridium pasteurianum DSM 525 = ATCC 6013 TaxID=1262449 RepID=A0A0H3J8R0_CLOPA|nr:3-dehydroquinate synthase [Clostridium pasteurianum]AJA49869.1 3-dehydroquinate synthase [Clostridium pasteurianum DSM 525 = ATCC 6013]AJA53857.1 3-dehydroquinate synthase [Clostridium pasteurianum DSM 525 = ATCC 6013]AOZ77012.1 3-dehydroquinate synthase [Clostridium pasteurianum DSM 525 = ATCC 6013]AOZ80809.1 3-dehydroquinate synthase [Clostridium pasteurianum]ELP57829.1 3-dehydroquinate synthase [Clostridium pasteurianum DSM 525 = ATCC 6013]